MIFILVLKQKYVLLRFTLRFQFFQRKSFCWWCCWQHHEFRILFEKWTSSERHESKQVRQACNLRTWSMNYLQCSRLYSVKRHIVEIVVLNSERFQSKMISHLNCTSNVLLYTRLSNEQNHQIKIYHFLRHVDNNQL
jgi:hypothetical protein